MISESFMEFPKVIFKLLPTNKLYTNRMENKIKV